MNRMAALMKLAAGGRYPGKGELRTSDAWGPGLREWMDKIKGRTTGRGTSKGTDWASYIPDPKPPSVVEYADPWSAPPYTIAPRWWREPTPTPGYTLPWGKGPYLPKVEPPKRPSPWQEFPKKVEPRLLSR